MIPHRARLFRAWLVGRDVQLAVYLLGVSHDDLATEREGELKSQLRLANAGRSNDDWNQ